MQQYGGWTVTFLSLQNTCKEAHPPPEYTLRKRPWENNLNTQFPIEETDRHVTTGSRFPKCLLLLGTSVCNWDVELSMHKLFSALSLWNAPLMKGKQQGRCCYDRTPWSTLGNLLQAPEICGSGARSIGNSQNECQNDLAVQICLKHFLSSRERWWPVFDITRYFWNLFEQVKAGCWLWQGSME